MARGHSTSNLHSYGYDLLRWWRWLRAIEVDWDKATSAEIRDYVLWLRQTQKPRNHARTRSAAIAGQVNPVTRKQNSAIPMRLGRCGIRMRCCAASTSIGSTAARVRWSIRSPWAGPVVDRMRITTRWGRSGRRAGSATTRNCPNRNPGRCRMSGGTTCSPAFGRTGIGPVGVGRQQWRSGRRAAGHAWR
ncbi:site-specific integrase [Saccharopolyspora soli]|uniref:site-specific integrase n=1 Tax=Saccharopolyspora soli TaxID=2926618 RepID=UPI0035580A46